MIRILLHAAKRAITGRATAPTFKLPSVHPGSYFQDRAPSLPFGAIRCVNLFILRRFLIIAPDVIFIHTISPKEQLYRCQFKVEESSEIRLLTGDSQTKGRRLQPAFPPSGSVETHINAYKRI